MNAVNVEPAAVVRGRAIARAAVMAALGIGVGGPACTAGPPWYLGEPLSGHPAIPAHSRALTVAEHRRAVEEANERDLRYQIREAGFTPQQRDILYNYIYRDDIDEIDSSNSMPLKKLSVAFAD